MSSNTSDPLEVLQCVAKQWVFQENAHLIQNLRRIEQEYSSFCVLNDRDLSQMYHYLDTLQRVEDEYGSFRVFSDNVHLLETANRIQQGCYSFRNFVHMYLCFHANKYPSLKGPDVTSTLERIAGQCYSLYMILVRYHFSEEYNTPDILQRIEEVWVSIRVFTDQYLSKSSHLLQTLRQTEVESQSFCELLAELQSNESDLLQSLLHIEQVWGSFRIYSEGIRSKISNFLEIPLRIGEECGSFLVFLETYLSSENSLQRLEYECGSFSFTRNKGASPVDQFRLLKKDFKSLGIILNLHNFEDEPQFIKVAQSLFQHAMNDLIQIQVRQSQYPIHSLIHLLSGLQHNFWKRKMEIRRTRYSFPEISFQLLANKNGIVIPNFVMESVDTVVENLSDLLKFNDPSSQLCIGGPMMGQIEKALEELKFLKSFICFVSDRCIEPQSQHTFFNHILEFAWHTTTLAWLYFPSIENQDSPPDEISSLFSELIESSICKIYIGVLKALKLVHSQWYPVIQINYIVDCEAGFVETLLHSLEELPISGYFTTIKGTLQEMLNLLRTNLINLSTELEFHLRDIDSMIIDAGLLAYSLIGNKDEKEATSLGETNKTLIQSMKETIYFITRKSFLLRPNLPRIDGLGSTGFILDNLQESIGCHLDSTPSIKNQLQTIQKKIKCFQKVVEQNDELQHFATQVMSLAYEVENIIDACKEEVPDWCLSLWILHIIEDINLLMKEVEDMQEMKVVASGEHTPQFASYPYRNEEMVGFKDVMVELIGKLIGGSSDLDVISIVGMAGLGKTTLANKLYFDQSVVSHFDIRVHCCVSQEYSRKGLLLDILRDITDERAELERETESELADKLRKLLMPKRYLVLIDDVWEPSAWDDLKLSCPEVNKGSRVIITTRHYEVAFLAKKISDPHKLRFFSTDESRMLLHNKVFNNESFPSALEDVSERISQKCGGLPLSIVLVAGMLNKIKGKHYWEQMAANLGPNIQAQSEHTLDLSYQNLPHYLKPLFLYLGVFPEDREIQVSKLMWLWIAEGFIETHRKELLEDIAKNYLENLIGRNLVMVAKKSSDGKIRTCRIHDLVLEFCRKKASSENFLEKIKGDRGPDHSCTPKSNTSRRLSIYSRWDSLEKWCLSFSHVKSFQFRELRNIAFSAINLASDTFKRFKLLRVLDLEFTMIDSFPQELTLLRYLAFRSNKGTLSLPANLWKLETLIVQGLGGRVSVPDTIWKMVKLRHIHIYDQAFFTLNSEEEFSESFSTMDDLQTISSVCFSFVENADKFLKKTPNLRKLRCEVSKFDGLFPAFSNLTKLEMLKISSGTRLTLINKLKFPSQLKKLTLCNFNIHLNEVATHPELEVLKLLGVTISSNKWEVTDEQFPYLKFLKLENLSFSEWHASDDAFPCLEHLVLKRCQYLKVIPSCFEDSSSLKSVEIISSNEALVESAKAVRETLIEISGESGFEIIIRT